MSTQMKNKCGKCTQSISPTKIRAQCKQCGGEFHLNKSCAGIQEASWITKPKESKNKWRCLSCREATSRESSTKRSRSEVSEDSNLSDSDQHSSYPTLEQIRLLMEATLGSKLQPLESKLLTELTSVKLEIAEIQKENDELKARVEQLEKTVDDNLQYQRRNNIIISNIPVQQNENVTEVVQKLFSEIKVDVQRYDIVAAHRLPRKNRNVISPPPIIVKFHHRETKSTAISASIKLKPTAAIFSPNDTSRIYLNDHLTTYNQKLFAEARVKLREAGCHSVSSNNGKIKCKIIKDSRPIIINSLEDIDRIRKLHVQGPTANTSNGTTSTPLVY